MADFDLWEFPEADHVEEGETAPDFTRPLVNDEFWEDVALSDLLDREPVLLVFYPMDGTGSAKYAWIQMRERGWGEDVTVVGLSISTPYEHVAFIDRHRLPFDLFSDPNNGVAEAYGVDREHHGMAGLEEPRPATFLIDEDRTVEYAWVASEWPEQPPYDEIESAMDALAA